MSHLYLWNAERSQVRTLNENKFKRIEKIVHEAVEQSRGWTIPKIEIIQDLKVLADQWNFVVFDLEKEEKSESKIKEDLPLL
ncbi:MAG: 16S rRNA (uracil(1498)-N(3))-methyltransferase [Patescibacteria group bacterium]|nr:16S rRNA (uracil(1498)-N(3))-methyltransferase [Patescibacteria group bacterium]